MSISAVINPQAMIFVNPIAGRGEGAGIAEGMREALRAVGWAVGVFDGMVEEIGVEGFDAKPQAAVVIGGDGTLRGVAERLIDVYGEPPPIAVIQLGTANLMGKHLSLKWRRDPERIVRAIQRRKVRRIDAGRANGRLFLLMAGVGIDGQVVHELSAIRKGPIGYVSYVLPAALALGRYDYPAIRVMIDGNLRFRDRPAIGFVGNVAEYGTGFPILPHARSDDGLLDVCVLPCVTRGDAIQLLLKAAVGEHLQVEGALYATGRHVRIESDVAVPIQIDGDAAGHTPLTIELLDVRVPFIVE